jgi:hypothetical protein
MLALFLVSFDRPMPRCRQVIGESGANPYWLPLAMSEKRLCPP